MLKVNFASLWVILCVTVPCVSVCRSSGKQHASEASWSAELPQESSVGVLGVHSDHHHPGHRCFQWVTPNFCFWVKEVALFGSAAKTTGRRCNHMEHSSCQKPDLDVKFDFFQRQNKFDVIVFLHRYGDSFWFWHWEEKEIWLSVSQIFTSLLLLISLRVKRFPALNLIRDIHCFIMFCSLWNCIWRLILAHLEIFRDECVSDIFKNTM